MSSPADFYDDRNKQQFYALDCLCPLPEFVKKAEVDDSVVPGLANNAFADPRHRKFPCHTKAATWLANAYFQKSRSAYSKKEAEFVQDRINKFASHWAISNQVDTFNKNWSKIASYDRPDLPDGAYALVATTDDGHKIRRFPMPNVMSVKWAGERLYADRHLYPYAMRKTAARNILREALKYDEMHKKGQAIPGYVLGSTNFEPHTMEYLERAAGFGAAHPTEVAEKLAQRVVMLRRTHLDHAEKLAQVALAVRDMETMNPAGLSKIASLVDAVDRETGLCDSYRDGVDMPEEMFFNVLEKEASDILDSQVLLTTGKSYPIGMILEIPLEKISSVLGDEFMDAVCGDDGISIDPVKFAEALPTLPRSDAVLLERAIEESFKEPLQKAARAGAMASTEFSKEELMAQMKKAGKKARCEDFTLTIRS